MYVISGAAGFIGSALVARFNQEGINNLLLVDELKSSDRWKNLLGKRFCDYFHKEDFIDSLERGELSPDIKGIVHLGACSSTLERDVDYLYRNNYLYTKRLALFAMKNKIRFVYASSAATYGNGSLGYDDAEDKIPSLAPLNPYGFSKQLFDLWAFENKHFSKICGIKFFNVFGPNEYHKEEMRSVVLKAYHQIKEFGVVKLFKSHRADFGDGEQRRDFIYVKDCTDVLLWLIRNPGVCGIYNLGTGKARTWNDLVTSVYKALGQA
ncbi:MAG: ADP-glyceromanno-heptose 6-epimerase, partial [SAR324 cluster bacterium]|nr:ADP-glyceromanno-heptose 6-epimerase [SAR324 cluster bacterium]